MISNVSELVIQAHDVITIQNISVLSALHSPISQGLAFLTGFNVYTPYKHAYYLSNCESS